MDAILQCVRAEEGRGPSSEVSLAVSSIGCRSDCAFTLGIERSWRRLPHRIRRSRARKSVFYGCSNATRLHKVWNLTKKLSE